MAVDHLARVRPGGVGMGKVARPEEVVNSGPSQGSRSNCVVEEGGEHLPFEVRARRLLDWRRIDAFEAVKIVVPLLERKRYPANLVLDDDQPQTRISLQD